MNESTLLVKEIGIGVVKAAMNAIPCVGTALTEAFFEIPNRIAQKRKENHLNAVIQELQTISDDSIDLNFIQSEDFSDLLQNILRKITLRNAVEKAVFFKTLTVA